MPHVSLIQAWHPGLQGTHLCLPRPHLSLPRPHLSILRPHLSLSEPIKDQFEPLKAPSNPLKTPSKPLKRPLKRPHPGSGNLGGERWTDGWKHLMHSHSLYSLDNNPYGSAASSEFIFCVRLVKNSFNR